MDTNQTKSCMKVDQWNLSHEQALFRQMLQKAPPVLTPYRDFESRSCNHEGLKADQAQFSHGEQVMAQLLIAVWMGKNAWSFDARPLELSTRAT